MSLFYFVSYTTNALDLERSQITDLQILDNDGTPILLSTTRYDGALQSWQMADTSISLIDTLEYDGGDRAGGTGAVTPFAISGNMGLITGGGPSGVLQAVGLNPDGSFGPADTFASLPTVFGGFQFGVTVALSDGSQAIYAGLAGEPGIAQLSFSEAGTLTDHAILTSPDTEHAGLIATTAHAAINGQSYVFTANPIQNAVTSWAVGIGGALTETDHINTDQGLWISAPSVMQAATIGDTTYLVLGAAGSNSISVMEVGPDGGLVLRDHLLDSLHSRFAGITALEIIAQDGVTYVIAAGADDGVSIFALLEGGYLLSRAHIADSVAMGLDNVSALAVQGRGDGLDIFVASSSEAGITQLRYDTGPAGITTTAVLAGGLLTGTVGNDILQGHNGDDLIEAGLGDDILRDGAGNDTLTGGDGTDTFVMSRDGVLDTIIDFALGEDKLDLSPWPLLRDISQLTFTIQPYGMDIAYGDELLVVRSADGSLIDYRELTTSDVIGDGMRFNPTIEPGYPGPAAPPPDTDPPNTETLAGEDGDLIRDATVIAVVKDASLADLRTASAGTASAGHGEVTQGSAGDDWLTGSDRDDIIVAGTGDDIVSGGRGADVLLGRAGADQLDGEGGGDLLMGGDGDDVLLGDAGDDRLYGGADDDRLEGGAGDDLLFGGAGADTFVFNGGVDTIRDFTQDIDQITLDASLWTGLSSAEDVLMVYGSLDGTRATIDLGDGNVLMIDGVTNYSTLALDIDLF